MSSAVTPPGSSGLMLGDTLGRRAGDTCDELILALLLLRGASCGVFLGFGVVAEEPGVNCGLWLAGAAAPGFANTGDGSGRKAEVPPEAGSDAGERICGDRILRGARAGFSKVLELTGSGSSKFSMPSAAVRSDSPGAPDLFALLGDGSLISEAGVAGEGFPVGRGAAAGVTFGVELPCG